MSRHMTALLACLGVVGTAAAGPISWGYTAVDNDSNVFFGSAAHITETDYALGNLIPRPVPPTFTPGPDDNARGYADLSSTTTTRVTITDEPSGQTGVAYLKWTVTENWTLDGQPAVWGSRQTEGVDPHPLQPTWLHIGANDYGVSTEGDSLRVLVRPSAVPEPATVLLCGLGAAGLGLVRLRRRSVSQPVA